MLQEVIRYIQRDKTLLQLLLSKIVTFPLLLLVLYKLQTDNNGKPTPINNSTKKKTPEPQGNDIAEPESALGVEIIPESRDFNWEHQEPIKYRPFKQGPYKLVMGIHNILPSEWLLIENTYERYLKLKAEVVAKYYDNTIFMSNDAAPQTIEFYQMVTEFMLKRYPMYFEIHGDRIYNKITNEYIPLDPYSVPDPKQLNVYLSRTIEEDFIILFPDEKNFNTDEFIFKSGVFAFAAGFDPRERYLKPLTDIHGPVPEYKSKLRPQMNKFFDKLKSKTYVRRNNWSIQTHNKLFVMNANKGVEDEEIPPVDPNNLDFTSEVYFRSERQLLTRLPKTGAIVFTIRTYLTPMSEIKNEVGKSEELIGGISGMQETIGQYKRKPEWGAAVISYLKGETNGVFKPELNGLKAF